MDEDTTETQLEQDPPVEAEATPGAPEKPDQVAAEEPDQVAAEEPDQVAAEDEQDQAASEEPDEAAAEEPDQVAAEEPDQTAAEEPDQTASGEPVAQDETVKSDAGATDVDEVTPSRTDPDVIASRPRRGRRVLTILAAVLVFLVIAAFAGVAYATYDFREKHEGKILPGATVAGVDVGGMTEKQAIRAVRKAIAPKLHRTISVKFGNKDWKVTPADLGARNNARAAVLTALDASESASWMDLAGMRFLDDELDLEKDVSIRHSKEGAAEFIASLQKDVNRAPIDAALDYSSGWVEITKEKPGHKVRTDKSIAALMKALKGNKGVAELSVRQIAPEVGADSFDQVILLRQNDFRVYLYQDGKITHDWPVAVGTSEYPTPTGVYSVELKRYMPTWVNPAPDGWGADMPDMIPPGPDNPLGLRAINWTAPAIRFHGTSSLSSIGTPASHGCVRMFNEDVIEMYDLVQEGVPIVSIWG